MIVDDHPDDLKLLRETLQPGGWHVLEASDGVEALALLERETVDAVVSDILMPNMDGYRFCYEVRHHPRFFQLPFIIHTGTYQSEDDELLAREMGADRYLTKQMRAKVPGALQELMAKRPSHEFHPARPEEQLHLVKSYSESLVQKLEAKNAELARATEYLRASEKRLRTIIQAEPECVKIVSHDGQLLDMNPAGLAMLDADSVEQLRARPLINLVAPEYRAAFAELDARVKRGESVTLVFEAIGLRGTRRWLEMHAVPLPDDQGRNMLLSITRDITKRKRSELRMAAFADLGKKLGAAKTIKDISETIIDLADQFFGWDSCSLDLYSSEKNRVFPVINKDLINDQRADCPPAYGDCEPTSWAKRAIEDGAQLVLRKEPLAFSPEALPYGDKSRPSASIMVVPIREGVKIVGVISIHSYRLNAYDRDDLDAFQALADHCGGALNRISSEQAHARMADRNAVLSRLGQRLNAAKTAREAGDIIMEVADQLFGWDSCGLHLYSPEKNWLNSIINKDLINGLRTDCPPPNEDSEPSPRAQHILTHGAQLILREEPLAFSPGSQAFGSNQPSASIMTVPIRDGARIVGLLSIQSYRLKAYHQEDLDTLQALADHCGGALNRISAEQAHTRMAERTAILSKLGQRLNAAKTAKEAAAIVIDVADQVFGWDSCHLDLYSLEKDQFSAVISQDLIDGKRTDCPPPYKEGEPTPLARRVIEEGAQLILREEPLGFSSSDIPFGDHSRPSASIMYVPIRDGIRLVGLLSIQSYKLKAYHRDDLDAFQTLADHCGGAFHRIAAQEAEMRQAKHTEAFSNLGQKLNSAKSALEAGQIIVEIARQLFGWDAASLDLYSHETNEIFPVLTMDLMDGKCVLVPDVPGGRAPGPKMEKTLREGAQLFLREDTARLPEDFRPFDNKLRVSASVMYVPIRSENTVIGLLSIQSYTHHAYDQDDLRGLQSLADHCAGALERIQAEDSSQLLQKQLRQSQKMEAIGQLAGGVAHDFNNLLTVVGGNVEMLLWEEQNLSPQARAYLTDVARATDRATSLTRQLLTFSRKQAMKIQPVDLNEVIGGFTKMLRRILGEDIQVESHFAPALPLIDADAGMIEQVLMNLFVNARDAMPKGGTLIIQTEAKTFDPHHAAHHAGARPGQFICLSVQDTGAGISPEHLAHIFEPFFTTKDIGKGTGLGLATVYGIVDQHKGWIEVASTLGRGTTFKIMLPVSAAAGLPHPQKTGDKALAGTGKILLVEDESGVRELCRHILEHFGYTVFMADSGVSAQKVWAEHRREIDLLFTDMVMPGGISGLELAEECQRQKPELKVILTSGYSAQLLGTDISDKPFSFLQKPYSPQAVGELIRASLAKN